MSKRTFQPSDRHRSRTHGFRSCIRTRAGRAILSARRYKGRMGLSARSRQCCPDPVGCVTPLISP